MSLIGSFMVWKKKARPFDSAQLDDLAQRMNVQSLLKKDVHRRYYTAKTGRVGAMSSSDVIIFDSKLRPELTDAELLALGAHEFKHLTENHQMERFWRMDLPAIALPLLGWILLFAYTSRFILLTSTTVLPLLLLTLIPASIPWVIVGVASRFANAGWHRQQETICDLAAVEYADGEALISALGKIDRMYPIKNRKTMYYRINSRLYPSDEQRAFDIRNAMNAKSQGPARTSY